MKNVDFRRQLTLTLLGNPGFFEHGLPSYQDEQEVARWLSLDDYDGSVLEDKINLSQTGLAVYLDGLVNKIIEIGKLD